MKTFMMTVGWLVLGAIALEINPAAANEVVLPVAPAQTLSDQELSGEALTGLDSVGTEADFSEGGEIALPLEALAQPPGDSAQDAEPPGAIAQDAATPPGTPAAVTEDLIFTLTPTASPVVAADGRSSLGLTGQITDGAGNPLDRDVVVTLTTSAGEFLGADYDRDRPGFQILARQGQFQVSLKSSLEAQQVRVRAAADGYAVRGLTPETTLDLLPDLEVFAEVEFITNLRPSLVSGLVELRLGAGGTNFLGSFAEFLNPDQIGRTEFDFGAALFATGTLGEWQFTGAFNSDRALNQTCDGNRLFRDVQFCEQRYPIYGDSSQVDYLTPSIDSFYARFQRDSQVPGAEPDYFMWGDYSTQEFARASQDFTAVTRQLHGFKGNYTLGNFQLTAMYANNLRPFQRDTLVPDGTSGYYFLSRRVILPGSEDIFIEVEELNRPGTVISRQQLRRGADYEIDYDRGALLFREPISATELNPLGQTLVRRIVTTYQVENVDTGGNLYAARLQYNFQAGRPDSGGWAGITLLAEDQGAQSFELFGADVRVPLGSQGEFTGEIATSSFDRGAQSADGSAYRLEISGPLFADNVLGRAYLRSASPGFSNTATTSFRPGQTRWGGQLSAALGDTTTLSFQVDQEINRGVAPLVTTDANSLLIPGQYETPGAAVDNTLTTFRAGIQQRLGSVQVGLDWVNRNRSDRLTNLTTNAHQLVPQLAVPLASNLQFRAQSEINFGEADALYPTRTTLGLDWAVEPGVTVRLAQQFISGEGQPGSVTSLDTLVDYALGDSTSLTSRYSLISGYGGLIGQSAIGLNHRIVLAPGLRVNLGLERIVSDAFNQTGAGQQFAQPYAVGYGATALGLQSGTSYFVGLEYTDNPDFQASARIEHRDSPSGDNTVLSAGVAGRITPALTALFRYRQANYANQTITGNLGDSISLKLGMAYRNPVSDQFNGLLSYEFRQNPATTPNTLVIGNGISTSDHTLALEGIYAPNWQWEFYGKYAFRLNDVSLSNALNVSSAVHLAQFRVAYRFAYRWDVQGEIRWISQPAASFSEVGLGLELGYYLTPDLRFGVGYSFGSVNSDGFGGSSYRSASGPYFGVQLKVNELLNGFGLQPVSPPQQRESYVDRGNPRLRDDLPEENLGSPSAPLPAGEAGGVR